MPVKRSDGRETRSRLLQSAAEIFAQKGFRAARTAEICRAAGANVAAINYYFGGKEALYAEAWRHAFEAGLAAWPPDGGVPENASARERLRGQLRAVLNRIMDPANLDFAILHKEMANPTGLLTEVTRRSLDPLRERFTATVRELLGPGAAERQVEMCVMSIHAQCFWPLMKLRGGTSGACRPGGCGVPQVQAEELAEHILHFSLAGIKETRRTLRETSARRQSGEKTA